MSPSDLQRYETSVALPPDLGRVAKLLANGIRQAMATLYALQTALINSLTRPREPNDLLDEVGRFRAQFRREWEKVKLFLEQCDRYSEEYISLCGFVFDEKRPSHIRAFLEDVSELSQKVLAEIKTVKTRHEKVSKDIEKRRAKLSSALAGTRSTDRSMVTGNRRQATSSDQYIRAAHASLHPNGADALVTSYDSLGQINRALGDLVVFWKDHVEQMIAVSGRQATLPFTKRESRSIAHMWAGYRGALQDAISSISFSMSAAEVEPIRPSHSGGRRHQPYGQDSHPSPTPDRPFWKRVFGGLFNHGG